MYRQALARGVYEAEKHNLKKSAREDKQAKIQEELARQRAEILKKMENKR